MDDGLKVVYKMLKNSVPPAGLVLLSRARFAPCGGWEADYSGVSVRRVCFFFVSVLVVAI